MRVSTPLPVMVTSSSVSSMSVPTIRALRGSHHLIYFGIMDDCARDLVNQNAEVEHIFLDSDSDDDFDDLVDDKISSEVTK
ncbi:uncharacterized protein DS421_9g266390 [Arachis hypogaea]|nr:uncharacterized protein DS421_9g266390 [Arachis hypogaea]